MDDFAERLTDVLERFSQAMPLVTTNRDVLAHRSASMLEATFRGWSVREAGDARIVVLPPGVQPSEHPLTRTIYVHPISDFRSVDERIDSHTQSIGVFPWSLALEHRDRWAAAGADRIMELGMSRHPKSGFTHDGARWLNQLVRIVCVEKPLSELYRYNALNSEQLEHWLFRHPLGLPADASDHVGAR